MNNTFVWATGQDDNIGDVVLRRRILRTLTPVSRCHIYVADATPSFLESLFVDAPDVVVYRSFSKWVWHASIASARGRSSIVFNPGEVKVSRWYAARYLALMPAQAISLLRRRPVIRVGVGIHDPAAASKSPWRHALTASTAMSTLVSWRSAESRSVTGIGAVHADLGFDERLTVDGAMQRDRIAISLRSDRAAQTDRWIDGIDSAARRMRLVPVVVVQVRRDRANAIALVERTGWDLLDWPEQRSLLRQEEKVRALYRQSALIVSDRLHALVIGLTEGGVPAGVTEHDSPKISTHFAAAGFAGVHVPVAQSDSTLIAKILINFRDRGPEFESLLRSAQRDLRAQDAIISSLVEHGARPK